MLELWVWWYGRWSPCCVRGRAALTVDIMSLHTLSWLREECLLLMSLRQAELIERGKKQNTRCRHDGNAV